ncbi:MAG TPA: GntR family transcriptional regulator [Gaiellaceae bacterium]|nr:GntR family transcriptional regulator [Gaiellaceae bacterium]
MTVTGDGAVRDHVGTVHDRLRSAILRGEIPPGQVTSQVVLARQLGVSRTPLREALRLLQREGLVLAEPNRQVRIAGFTLADVEGLYAMRIALEAVAIRATVPTLTPEDLAELEGLMAQMDHYMRSVDMARMDVPHALFHARFVRAGGARLTTAIAQLFDHAQRYRLAYLAGTPGGGYADRRAEHRAMIDAAAAGDVEATIERLVAHYVRTARLTISQLDPDHDPSVLRAAVASVAPRALPSLDDASAVAEPALQRRIT